MIESLQQLFKICDDITVHSNQVTKKSLFVAYPGSTFDGRDFIDHVIKTGVSAVLYDTNNFVWKKEWELPHLGIDNLKERLPEIASEFYEQPSDNLRVVGITGTNGKTTSVQWLSSCLNQLDRKTGFIGTTGYGDNFNINSITNTTPDIFTIQKIIREFKEKDTSYIAMEVSSHAIDQGRIDNLKFDIKVLTNITRDHLDYHGNIANYIKCKTKFLLSEITGDTIIINNDENNTKTELKSKFGVIGDIVGSGKTYEEYCTSISTCQWSDDESTCKKIKKCAAHNCAAGTAKAPGTVCPNGICDDETCCTPPTCTNKEDWKTDTATNVKKPPDSCQCGTAICKSDKPYCISNQGCFEYPSCVGNSAEATLCTCGKL